MRWKGSSSASMNTRPIMLTTSTLRAVGGLEQIGAAPRRARGVVGGADQARLALDEHQRLALIEGVVAERDRVDAGGEEFLADRLGDAEAAGGVLAVDDDEIEPPARAQARQMRSSSAARPERPTMSPTNRRRISRGLRASIHSRSVRMKSSALVVRLVGHGGRPRRRIGDADRADRPAGAQALQRAVVVARAVADAMAAPIEGGERHEQQIGIDGGRPPASARGCSARRATVGSPGAPEPEGRAARRAAP